MIKEFYQEHSIRTLDDLDKHLASIVETTTYIFDSYQTELELWAQYKCEQLGYNSLVEWLAHTQVEIEVIEDLKRWYVEAHFELEIA